MRARVRVCVRAGGRAFVSASCIVFRLADRAADQLTQPRSHLHQMAGLRKELARPQEVSLAEFTRLQSALARAADEAYAAALSVKEVQVGPPTACLNARAALRAAAQPKCCVRLSKCGEPACLQLACLWGAVGGVPALPRLQHE